MSASHGEFSKKSTSSGFAHRDDFKNCRISEGFWKITAGWQWFRYYIAVAASKLGAASRGRGVGLVIDASTVWQSAKDFCNSVFFTAIIGSLAGAFAGAYGGQRIVARGKEREELITEIRNTSAATVVSFAICNSFVSIKQQHVKPIKDAFDKQKAAFLAHAKSYRLGQLPHDTVFPFTADFRTLFLPPFPIDTLRQLVFEKLSLDERRPLMLVTTLAETIHGINTSIENRNRLIASYKATNFSGNDLLYLYFGFPHGERRITNDEYPSLIEAIYQQTDDGIFFSKLLCDDLVAHNRQLAARYRRKFKKGAPAIIDKPDFTKPEKAQLMPNEADYADWFDLFVKMRKADGSRRKFSFANVRGKLTDWMSARYGGKSR